MARICIATGSHLCRNPRVVKEASALSEAGHEVTVLGPAFTGGRMRQDEQILRSVGWQRVVTVDLRPFQTATWQRFWWRGLRRLATEACYRFGWETPHALGYGLGRTLKLARRAKADLYIGHQEIGAWVAVQLLQEGRCAGADLEDWYARDLLPEAQAGRPLDVLESCEATLLKHGDHVTTTSGALASALSSAYGAPEPSVVYNASPWAEREGLDGQCCDRADGERPSLHWFSQTIGPGRGLDTLCRALRAVNPPIDLHLRGHVSPDMERHVRGLFPSHRGHRLWLHGLVPPGELMSRIVEHDIGLALEPSEPPNKDSTVSNKILQYLLAGLAVVATPTAGQREVAAAAPGAVHLCEHSDAAGLAEQIQALVQSPERLRRAKEAALEAARDKFCWEKQRPVLLDSVERALV